MKTDDIVAIIAFTSFGGWWLLAPRTVIRFYSWLGKRELTETPLTIRVIGLLSMILVVTVSAWQIHNRSVMVP